jgi:hypothetical protein
LESGGENSGWSSRIIPRPLFWTGRIASALIGPAAFALAVACCLPWAHVVILHTVDVSVPGILFESGCRIFAAAVGILLVRRLPVFSLIAAGFAYSWLASAASDVPHRVMHQVIGVQLSLFPINRLLDQFHLPNIEFANTFAPRKTDLLTPAFTWSRTALQALLLLSLLAIPADPALIWIARRVVPAQCRACGKRWKATRDAAFCPECGTPVHRTPRIVCSRCGTAARKGDKHCVKCGETLEA